MKETSHHRDFGTHPSGVEQLHRWLAVLAPGTERDALGCRTSPTAPSSVARGRGEAMARRSKSPAACRPFAKGLVAGARQRLGRRLRGFRLLAGFHAGTTPTLAPNLERESSRGCSLRASDCG